MSSWNIALTLAMGCTVGLAQSVKQDTGDPLMFDMPYGECRLHVRADGSGRLMYGAHPEGLEIAPNTFDLPDLISAFKARVDPSKLRSDLTPPVGGVRLGRMDADMWFNDAAFARNLFDKALKNRVDGKTAARGERGFVVVNGCARR